MWLAAFLLRQTKKPLCTKGFELLDYGAVERTRTSTGVRPLPPQDSVSAIPPLPHVFWEGCLLTSQPRNKTGEP